MSSPRPVNVPRIPYTTYHRRRATLPHQHGPHWSVRGARVRGARAPRVSRKSAIHRGIVAVGLSLHSIRHRMKPCNLLRHCLLAAAPDSSPGLLLSGACIFDFASVSTVLCTYFPTGVEGEAAPAQRKSSKCRLLPQVIHHLRLSFTENPWLASLS